MAISNVLRDSFNKHIKEHGENVLVDNIPTRAFFKEYDDKKNSHDHKYIFTNIGLVKQGSIIMLRGQKWLSIAHIENINGVYEKSLIREIKFCLKWQDKAIPCVIDSRMQSENSGQFITLPTGNVNIGVPTQTAATVNIDMDFTNTKQVAGTSTVAYEKTGYAAGTLDSVSLNKAGEVVGTFSNGQNQVLAQVALAAFNNPGGLTKLGSNTYSVSANSGEPQIGTAATGGRGSLTPGALEMSNVDLSQQFSDMIVTQRGFQSNSKIITVSDEMLETLVNMKR